MPEPRRYRPAVVSVQYDPTDRRTVGDAAARRDIAARAADNYPAGRPSRRRRAGDGYPVQVRNGMPAPRLRPVTDTARCGCVRRLDPAVMDWELVIACGARHE